MLNHHIPLEDVNWILTPNKDDPLPSEICTNQALTIGQIAITYKHYLALEDIVKNKYSISVIMEDNISFKGVVPNKLLRYLRELPTGWGCLFDSDLLGLSYLEGPVTHEKIVYPKTNEITSQCHGGSKGANFILISYSAAKLMYENFLPFNNVSDHYYNFLLRKLQIQSFWAEPSNVHKVPRPSTWI
jgi:hypothetical protein